METNPGTDALPVELIRARLYTVTKSCNGLVKDHEVIESFNYQLCQQERILANLK